MREAESEPGYPACPRTVLIRDCRWVSQSRIDLHGLIIVFIGLITVFFRHAKVNKGFDEEEEGMQDMMYFLSKLSLKIKLNGI